jgi:hypothetical protein
MKGHESLFIFQIDSSTFHSVELEGFVRSIVERNVTTFAPHKVLKLIA